MHFKHISVFPIPGGGECSSMMTGTSAAYWINEHCDENDQPFMCRRAGRAFIHNNLNSTGINWINLNCICRIKRIYILQTSPRCLKAVLRTFPRPEMMSVKHSSFLNPKHFKIYSPGIPNSDIPCGYMLFVAANKLVELEVNILDC